MFKISKGSIPDRFTIECYVYIEEAKFHSLVYTVANIDEDTAAQILKGRSNDSDNDDADFALDIARLTNNRVMLNDEGRLLPVYTEYLERVDNGLRILQAEKTRIDKGIT